MLLKIVLDNCVYQAKCVMMCVSCHIFTVHYAYRIEDVERQNFPVNWCARCIRFTYGIVTINDVIVSDCTPLVTLKSFRSHFGFACSQCARAHTHNSLWVLSTSATCMKCMLLVWYEERISFLKCGLQGNCKMKTEQSIWYTNYLNLKIGMAFVLFIILLMRCAESATISFNQFLLHMIQIMAVDRSQLL